MGGEHMWTQSGDLGTALGDRRQDRLDRLCAPVAGKVCATAHHELIEQIRVPDQLFFAEPEDGAPQLVQTYQRCVCEPWFTRLRVGPHTGASPSSTAVVSSLCPFGELVVPLQLPHPNRVVVAA